MHWKKLKEQLVSDTAPVCVFLFGKLITSLKELKLLCGKNRHAMLIDV